MLHLSGNATSSIKEFLTFQVIRDVFVLAFLYVKSRQVIVSPATHHPNECWVVAQTKSFIKEAKEMKLPIGLVQHDRDTKFTKRFKEMLQQNDVKPIGNRYRAPNTYIERFVQSSGQECLDRFVIFGPTHMDYLCQEYLEHYHQGRPHQGLANEILVKPRSKQSVESSTIVRLKEIRCKRRLSGLLKSYSRKAD